MRGKSVRFPGIGHCRRRYSSVRSGRSLLSFLGLGVGEPAPGWGNILSTLHHCAVLVGDVDTGTLGNSGVLSIVTSGTLSAYRTGCRAHDGGVSVWNIIFRRTRPSPGFRLPVFVCVHSSAVPKLLC